MKTSEILEHITGPMLDDRPEMVSGESDSLFKDSTVIRYLNAAEQLLCRDAWVVEDFMTPKVCEITLETGKINYPLHSSILFVKAARLSDTDIDLVRIGYDDNRLRASVSLASPDYWDINSPLTDTPGRPQWYSTDMGNRTIRLRPICDTTTNGTKVRLTVVRMPLTPMSVDNPDKEPEVPEEFHLDLARYAAGCCLANTADIDADARSLGRSWIKDFVDYVAKAKRDRLRAQQSPPRWLFGAWARGEDWGT